MQIWQLCQMSNEQVTAVNQVKSLQEGVLMAVFHQHHDPVPELASSLVLFGQGTDEATPERCPTCRSARRWSRAASQSNCNSMDIKS